MYIEGAWERALVPPKSDLGFKEPEIKKRKEEIKVQIGPSRIMDLVLHVPPSLSKVFWVRSYARAVHISRLDGGLTEAELLVQLWMDRAVVLKGRPDSFDSVRGLDGR